MMSASRRGPGSIIPGGAGSIVQTKGQSILLTGRLFSLTAERSRSALSKCCRRRHVASKQPKRWMVKLLPHQRTKPLTRSRPGSKDGGGKPMTHADDLAQHDERGGRRSTFIWLASAS